MNKYIFVFHWSWSKVNRLLDYTTYSNTYDNGSSQYSPEDGDKILGSTLNRDIRIVGMNFWNTYHHIGLGVSICLMYTNIVIEQKKTLLFIIISKLSIYFTFMYSKKQKYYEKNIRYM